MKNFLCLCVLFFSSVAFADGILAGIGESRGTPSVEVTEASISDCEKKLNKARQVVETKLSGIVLNVYPCSNRTAEVVSGYLTFVR